MILVYLTIYLNFKKTKKKSMINITKKIKNLY